MPITGYFKERERVSETDRQTERESGKETDRQTDIERQRQGDRQTETERVKATVNTKLVSVLPLLW